jgi:hypothetical protein
MRTRQARSRVAVRRGPGRLQIILAAAWMILSLLIGGLISSPGSGDRASTPTNVTAITP